MPLVKALFWLVILILLLPADAQDQKSVFRTAETAVRDMGAFCSRNPTVCERGWEAWDTFSRKAEFGAKMVLSLFDGSRDWQNSPSDPKQQQTSGGLWYKMFAGGVAANTLTPTDLEPDWRGPAGGAP